MSTDIERLPGLIAHAIATLEKATTAAEILEARNSADAVYSTAKLTARLTKVKDAHDTVQIACRKAMADALVIESRAQCRLADEYDAAQERGEVAKNGQGAIFRKVFRPVKNNPTLNKDRIGRLADLGLTSMQVSEARFVRDAEKAAPGIVRRTVDERLRANKEPTRADVKRAVQVERAKGGATRCRRKAPKRHDAANTVVALSDTGRTRGEIATETGIPQRQVRHIIEEENIRREASAQVDPSTLSLTAQEKLEAAIRQHKRQLDMQFEQRVLSEIEKRVNEMVLPTYNKTYAEWQDVIERRGRGGVMDKATFNKIVSCLHADSRLSASEQKLNEAFHAFHKLEHLLVKDPEPAVIRPLPKTYEEMMALKKSVSEARKQNRQAMRAR